MALAGVKAMPTFLPGGSGGEFLSLPVSKAFLVSLSDDSQKRLHFYLIIF